MVDTRPVSAEVPPEAASPRRRGCGALILAVLYLALLLGIWVGTRLVAERWWLTTLLLYFPQVVYLAPAALTIPAALLARDRVALRVNAAAVLVVLGLMMGFNVPLGARAAPDSPRVRVLAYNMHGGRGEYADLRRQVLRFRPDVVMLVESRDEDDSGQLRGAIDEWLPGWSVRQGGDVRIASRWPFRSSGAEPLGSYRERIQYLNRYRVHALVEAPFGRFNIAGVHFRTSIHGRDLREETEQVPEYMTHTGDVRRQQARDLVSWARSLRDPVIIGGDFNTPPAGEIYGSLRSYLGDAFADRGWGWGYTFPTGRPVLRIDYVLHSRQWRTTAVRVGYGPGSDHVPVFAELALQGSGR